MTDKEAIEKLENFAKHLEPNEEFIMAIKAMNFITFLMNIINPNEMEVYLSMYNAQDDKVEVNNE